MQHIVKQVLESSAPLEPTCYQSACAHKRKLESSSLKTSSH
ncbi:hypothetical protein [Helicobacter canis]|nr:hypothetical protein [Helicobacter canis]